MKTTVEIPDSVLAEAKRVAAAEGVTLRALIEHGLRSVLAERRGTKPFKLRRASVRGKGLRPEVQDGSWERIRALIYEGRGG